MTQGQEARREERDRNPSVKAEGGRQPQGPESREDGIVFARKAHLWQLRKWS